jgi:Mor family transcriptional regulator
MLDYLTKEDLPESLRDVVDVIGIDNMKELIRLAGGSNLYIPSENSVTKPVRNKIIKEAFKG